MFGAIAPRYDCLNHLLSFQFDRLWRREAIRLLEGKKRVLDLCAGTLDLSILLAKRSEATRVDSIDFSKEMLRCGEAKLDESIRNRVTPCCGDVQQLPYKDKSFNGAMVAYGMRNVDDNQRALTEVLRVLKPGSSLVILEFFKPTHLSAKLFHATYGRLVLPVLGGLVSGNLQAYRYLRDSIRGFYSTDDYASLMERCGFKDVSYKHQWGGASTLFVGVKP